MSLRRGYTLVELIVSIGIFSVVMLVATAALLSLVSLDRQARATNDVVTNLSFVIDSMARSVRTGTNYACNGAGDCSAGASCFSFVDYQGQNVSYVLKTDNTIGQNSAASCSTATATSLTDPRIQITSLKFYVLGSVRTDTIQPRVLFTATGTITPSPQSVPVTFTIESSATQRLIDL